ncbi:hypothetical protein CRM22_009694 [Opisthorchis felineus]|uniref:Uncharacterized protein n=1 Tax=Opisthorchis felineus TaxID=147828 RepID=A0A4S2LD28_OPIFE|nr:hypothetical protein CRM22_009694 [Opisthorchis felineus]
MCFGRPGIRFRRCLLQQLYGSIERDSQDDGFHGVVVLPVVARVKMLVLMMMMVMMMMMMMMMMMIMVRKRKSLSSWCKGPGPLSSLFQLLSSPYFLAGPYFFRTVSAMNDTVLRGRAQRLTSKSFQA